MTPRTSFYNQLTDELVAVGTLVRDYALVGSDSNSITNEVYN
ncbi:hypothetical protein OAL67_00455 [bacterium]|nr:hypothetical protein [bacterium]